MKGYRKYFGKKILWFVITFVVAVFLNFFLPRLMPADPVAAITGKMASGMTDASAVQEIYKRYKEEFGTNKPMWQQFLIFCKNAVRGDFGLNIYNSRAMHYLREQKIESQLVSFEMTLPQLRDLSKAVPVEVLVYGRLPLMLMENCVIKNRTGSCSCENPTKLIDRMGEEFPVLKDPGTCRNVLYNGKKLYILDKLSSLRGMGLWAHRLSFTTENPSEVDGVLAQYQGQAMFDPGTCTRGLYVRGVE